MAFCRLCGRSDEVVGELSVRGKCLECGKQATADAITQIRQHSGPIFTKWRHNHARAVTPPDRYAELDALLDDVG